MSTLYKNVDEPRNTEGKKPSKTYALFYKTQKQAELIYTSGVRRVAVSEVEGGVVTGRGHRGFCCAGDSVASSR